MPHSLEITRDNEGCRRLGTTPFYFEFLDDSLVEGLRHMCVEQESRVLELDRSADWRSLAGHETTARYRHYNLLTWDFPEARGLHCHILRACAALDAKRCLQLGDLLVQCWMNIHRFGEALPKHSHKFPLHGHLTVQCGATATVYDTSIGLVSVPNAVGLLTLVGKSHVPHYVTPHDDPRRSRITIAFDCLPSSWTDTDASWRDVVNERTFIPLGLGI